MSPAIFEDIATRRSEAAGKCLGERRAIELNFIKYDGHEADQLTLLLTYANARDLAISIIELIGPTLEFQTMAVLQKTLEGLRDFQQGKGAIEDCVPSEN